MSLGNIPLTGAFVKESFDLKRVTQRVNPYVVSTSFIIAFLAPLPIFWIEFSLITALFFIMVFTMSLACESMFTWYAFRRVIIDERGIRCGKVFIEWRNVKTVRVFRAYAGFPNRYENAEKEINTKHFEYPIGVMIGINADTDENIMNFGKGIYISRTAKVDRILKKYCRLYSEYTEGHTQSKATAFQKGKNDQWFFGNPLLLRMLFLNNLLISALVFGFACFMFHDALWKAFMVGLFYHICIWRFLILAYRDAFLLVRVNEHGIFFEAMMIPWDKISDVREVDVVLSTGFNRMNCGTMIAVNTEVGDRYLGRHVYDGVYFYKTKKTMKLFSKYLRNED